MLNQALEPGWLPQLYQFLMELTLDINEKSDLVLRLFTSPFEKGGLRGIFRFQLLKIPPIPFFSKEGTL